MQKRILQGLMAAAACGLFCVDAMAISPGFYLGVMMGPATNGASRTRVQVLPVPTADFPTAKTAPANPSSTQFGSRFYFGYKMNEYAGFELGVVYYSGIDYKVIQNPALASPGTQNPPITPAASTTARVRNIDLVGKLDYSYNNTIGFFAKGGVALAYTTTPAGLNITNYTLETRKTKTGPRTFSYATGSNQYKSKLAPTFSIGATYDINQSWQADLSWTRLLVGGATGNMNLYALGLSYHFVDVYCGQFLCSD